MIRFSSISELRRYLDKEDLVKPFDCENLRVVPEDVYCKGTIYREGSLICCPESNDLISKCAEHNKDFTFDGKVLKFLCDWDFKEFKIGNFS